MAGRDEFVRRIVSRSGVSSPRAQRELQRELDAHLEDASEEVRLQGRDEASILRAVCERFGDPAEIAREFELAYRFERRTTATADALILFGSSVGTVAALILTLQLAIASRFGISPPEAFPRLRGELVAFVSLALGYVGIYLGERLFHQRRLLKAFGINCALFTFLFALCYSVLHLSTLAPAVPFFAGVAVRMLQRTVLRPFWCLATMAPTVVNCLSGGPLLITGHSIPLWAAILVRWLGLTMACYLLTLLSRNHEVRTRASLIAID